MAAYFVFTAISNVGIDQVVKELEHADSAWLWAALVVVPIIPVAQAFGTLGATTLPLRLGPVIALEYAIQFIALAVPSSAARVALNVRFFQRQGAPAAQALTIGLIDSVFGFIVQVILLVTILLSGLVTLDVSLDGLDIDPDGKILVLVGLLALVAVVVALTVPRIRGPIAARVAEARPALVVVRSPIKLAGLVGGNFAAQLLLAIVLGLTVRAFGQSATLAELLLTNTLVSLFAGVMPIPGGIGVSEAAIAFCLTALGIPSSTAAAIAIVFRLLTFYLPPIWGGFAMRWLRRQAYL
ncbi:MAG TPA: lysylphosphatidylglycerol synthase transmembrane domain-containing protein [Actinomycetota bacterium]|nr:lysylphosphatidylglycerol synthase transmembrane domain-containing protein [Actinomycetota bacterium]